MNQLSTASPAPEVKEQIQRQYISLKIKREIWRKASGKCTNCESEHALEIDHVRPLSKNGNNEPENLRLLCRQCNQRAAIVKLGQDRLDRYLT